ncbi:MAG: lyase family protein [Bacteroidales bacterium]
MQENIDEFRIERDFLGEKQIPKGALYGIQSLRARDNFPDTTRFNLHWYKALGWVKLACYQTYQSFARNVREKNLEHRLPSPLMEEPILEALMAAASEISEGKHFQEFIVPAISGGAGTSINMNINEIIANRALQILGRQPGEYSYIDPVEQANVYQSTNDVVPTALKVAVMQLLERLETSINELRKETERLEGEGRKILRIGRTQMQDAVPSSYGMLFAAYNDALSRDWWRVSKAFERIKVINLGGGAIGTGIGIPRYYIMEAVRHLQTLTGLPLTRSENLPDATSNLDSLTEVHAIVKAHAVNLEKMVSDLRLLASDVAKPSEIILPKKQLGSTIMPGKVNPVIPEFVISVAHQVYANDQLITGLAAQGCLDLNAYLPILGHRLLESLELLIAADNTLKNNMFQGLNFDVQASVQRLWLSPSITTALSPYIGYHKAAELARFMQENRMDIFTANEKLGLMDAKKLKEIMLPEKLLQLGFSVYEL